MPQTVPYELDLRIVDLIRRDKVEIPPYPAVAMRLHDTLSCGDEYRVADVVRIVEADQMLAASALRYANSPALRSRAGPITSLRVAVPRLGRNELMGLALAVGIAAKACKNGSVLALRRMVWRGAVFCAELCRQLASRRGLEADQGFSCGLLHDFGKVIALGCLEQILSVDEQFRLSPDRCLDIAETYHVELGTVMAERWRLPDIVCGVIAGHHGEEAAPERHQPMIELVRACDHVVALIEDQTNVSVADVRRVSYFAHHDEWRTVAGLVTQLPAIASAFEPPREMRPVRNTTLTGERVVLDKPQTTMEGELPYPVDLGATCVTIDGPTDYRCTYVTRSGFGLRGAMPLGEQSLVQVRLHADPTLDLWGTVMLCSREGSGFRVELHLLALDEETVALWAALLSAVQEGETGSAREEHATGANPAVGTRSSAAALQSTKKAT